MPASWALYPDDPSSATERRRRGLRGRREAGPHATLAAPVAEHAHHVDHVAREVLHTLVRVAAERRRRHRVGARRAADAEIDPPGMERLEHRELLGDRERGVVRQHDAARPDPDAFGGAGDVGDQDGRRRAGDGRHVVVFGDPETHEPEPLGGLRQPRRVGQRLGRGAALADHGQIEHRQRDHAVTIRTRLAEAI